ncbi:MAG: hypothetical protein EOO41_01315, partial [Methanobacteriota archaeon]
MLSLLQDELSVSMRTVPSPHPRLSPQHSPQPASHSEEVARGAVSPLTSVRSRTSPHTPSPLRRVRLPAASSTNGDGSVVTPSPHVQSGLPTTDEVHRAMPHTVTDLQRQSSVTQATGQLPSDAPSMTSPQPHTIRGMIQKQQAFAAHAADKHAEASAAAKGTPRAAPQRPTFVPPLDTILEDTLVPHASRRGAEVDAASVGDRVSSAATALDWNTVQAVLRAFSAAGVVRGASGYGDVRATDATLPHTASAPSLLSTLQVSPLSHMTMGSPVRAKPATGASPAGMSALMDTRQQVVVAAEASAAAQTASHSLPSTEGSPQPPPQQYSQPAQATPAVVVHDDNATQEAVDAAACAPSTAGQRSAEVALERVTSTVHARPAISGTVSPLSPGLSTRALAAAAAPASSPPVVFGAVPAAQSPRAPASHIITQAAIDAAASRVGDDAVRAALHNDTRERVVPNAPGEETGARALAHGGNDAVARAQEALQMLLQRHKEVGATLSAEPPLPHADTDTATATGATQEPAACGASGHIRRRQLPLKPSHYESVTEAAGWGDASDFGASFGHDGRGSKLPRVSKSKLLATGAGGSATVVGAVDATLRYMRHTPLTAASAHTSHAHAVGIPPSSIRSSAPPPFARPVHQVTPLQALHKPSADRFPASSTRAVGSLKNRSPAPLPYSTGAGAGGMLGSDVSATAAVAPLQRREQVDAVHADRAPQVTPSLTVLAAGATSDAAQPATGTTFAKSSPAGRPHSGAADHTSAAAKAAARVVDQRKEERATGAPLADDTDPDSSEAGAMRTLDDTSLATDASLRSALPPSTMSQLLRSLVALQLPNLPPPPPPPSSAQSASATLVHNAPSPQY